MKRRLREATLTQMKLTLAREESVAEESSRAFEGASFREVALLRDQDIANEIWMIDDNKRLLAHPKSYDVAVLVSETAKKPEEIATHTKHEVAWISRRWTRWKAWRAILEVDHRF